MDCKRGPDWGPHPPSLHRMVQGLSSDEKTADVRWVTRLPSFQHPNEAEARVREKQHPLRNLKRLHRLNEVAECIAGLQYAFINNTLRERGGCMENAAPPKLWGERGNARMWLSSSSTSYSSNILKIIKNKWINKLLTPVESKSFEMNPPQTIRRMDEMYAARMR